MTPTESQSGDPPVGDEPLPRGLGPYSPSASSAGLLFLSGQVAKQPGTINVSGTVAEQTTRCLHNLFRVLADHDLAPDALLKCNVYLVDMADFDAMNIAYEAVLGGHRPARTTIAVAGLPLGARVEVEAVAERPGPDGR